MKTETILWATLGASVLALIMIKKDDHAPVPSPAPAPGPALPQPLPPKQYGEATRVELSVPGGWRRATGAEVSALPELRSKAVALRNAPGFTSMTYGALAPFTASDGKTYATWVEQHYHPPEGSAKPWGLHHGVTVLAKNSSSA